MKQIPWSILGALVLAVAGCDWIAGPEHADGPYYFYASGERIPVAIDRTHIVVRTEPGVTLSEERFPSEIEIVRRFGAAPGYEAIELAPPATAEAERALRGLAEMLQDLPEVRFTSFRYRSISSNA
jgi:hypothetical protein